MIFTLMVINEASWSLINGQGKTSRVETFSMVFVMIWCRRTLPFCIGFSMTLVKSYFLRISLYSKLMSSFSFIGFTLKSPMITMFDDHVERILKIKWSYFVSQSFLPLSFKFSWQISPKRHVCLLSNSTHRCSNDGSFSIMWDLIFRDLIVPFMHKPTPPLFLLSGFDIQNCIHGYLQSLGYCCHFLATFLIVRFHQNYKCLPWLWIHQTLISSFAYWDDIG